MKPEFECGVTASFLRSGAVLSNASHCAALIAAAGLLLTHPAAGRLWFATSILCWPIASYLGVRVAIDASLFHELAADPDDRGRALDERLRRTERTLAERSRGALRLWTRLIVTVAVQLAILAAAMVIQVLAT